MALDIKLKSLLFYGLKHQDIGLSTEERDALQKLKNNSTLIIRKPGKGNGVTVLNKDDYINEMNKILSNEEQF